MKDFFIRLSLICLVVELFLGGDSVAQNCNPHCYLYKYSSGFPYKWTSNSVSYYVNSEIGDPDGITTAQWISAIEAAHSAWNAAGSAFTFSYAGTTTDNWGDDTLYLTTNDVGWYIDGDTYSLAYTTQYYDLSTGKMDYATTWFNQDSWIEWSLTPSAGTTDIQSVATHEFGHWLVLADEHTGCSANTMYVDIPTNDTTRRSLTQDDVFGMQSLYPITKSNTTIPANSQLGVFENWSGTITADHVEILTGVTVNVLSGCTLTVPTGSWLKVDAGATLNFEAGSTRNASSDIVNEPCGSMIDNISHTFNATEACLANHGYYELGKGKTAEFTGGAYFTLDTTAVIQIDSGATFKLDVSADSGEVEMKPGAVFRLGKNAKIYSNIPFIAKGTSTKPITFTSMNASPAPGDWNEIFLYAGPDTFMYCNIKYATTGINMEDSASTPAYLAYDTISHCGADGVDVWNFPIAGSEDLKIYKCRIDSNKYVGLSVESSVGLAYTRIEGNGSGGINPGVLVSNGGMIHLDSSRIQNDVGSGIEVTGAVSYATLSANGTTPGYNTVSGHGVSELYVHNSGQAFLGYMTGVQLGGDNNVYNSYSYTGRLIDNAVSGSSILARYTYWGTQSANEFSGTVDTAHQLGAAVSTPAVAFHLVPPGNRSSVLGMGNQSSTVDQLKADIANNVPTACDELYMLQALAAPNCPYAVSLGMSWDSYLAGIVGGPNPQRLVNLATGMRISSANATGNYSNAIQLANQTLSASPDSDMWYFCNEQKVLASVRTGNLTAAQSEYAAMQSQAMGYDSVSTTVLGKYLKAQIDAEPFSKSAPAKKVLRFPSAVPKVFALLQNYPNPFNPTTTIQYSLPKDSRVELRIFNVLGQQVRTLIDGYETAGFKSVVFNASDMPSGLYFYRITAGSFTDVKKMMLIK